eukprot:UN02783
MWGMEYTANVRRYGITTKYATPHGTSLRRLFEHWRDWTLEGGAYTMESATKAKQFPIKAGVYSHGGSSNAAPDIPSNLPVFFVSGTADPRRRKLYWAYQATTSVPRIFATIEGGKHIR